MKRSPRVGAFIPKTCKLCGRGFYAYREEEEYCSSRCINIVRLENAKKAKEAKIMIGVC